MVIGENKSMVINPRDSIRRLNNIVGIRPHITHRRAASLCLELLNGRVRTDCFAIEKFTSNRIDGWTMVDQEDTQSISILVSSNI